MDENTLVEQAISLAWTLPIVALIALSAWLVLCDLRRKLLGFPAAALTAGADVLLALITIPVVVLVTIPVHDEPPYRLLLSPGQEIYQGLFGGSSSMQLLGNLLLFVPLFAIAPLRIPCLRGLRSVVFAAAALTVSVELGQYLMPFGRVASVDDVLLNSVGALLGALLTRPWWAHGGRPRPDGAGHHGKLYRFARLIAATTARSDAVMIELSTPTPHSTSSPIAHST